MAKWRAAATERLPELIDEINAAPNIMSLWIELHLHFKVAYREPQNESLIARIYSYADWCMNTRHNSDPGRDPSNAVGVAFFEHIPDDPAARAEMPVWFTPDQIRLLRSLLVYRFGDAAYEQLLAEIIKNSYRYRPRVGTWSTKDV
jgi:hypothetical protein